MIWPFNKFKKRNTDVAPQKNIRVIYSDQYGIPRFIIQRAHGKFWREVETFYIHNEQFGSIEKIKNKALDFAEKYGEYEDRQEVTR